MTAFRAFAATGDASKVHPVARTSEGLPSCPEPTIYATVNRGLTSREVEADLSAFFVQSGLINNRCQALVFAFHSLRDYRAHLNGGYTVGRVALTRNAYIGYNLEVVAGDISGSASGTFTQARFDVSF